MGPPVCPESVSARLPEPSGLRDSFHGQALASRDQLALHKTTLGARPLGPQAEGKLASSSGCLPDSGRWTSHVLEHLRHPPHLRWFWTRRQGRQRDGQARGPVGLGGREPSSLPCPMTVRGDSGSCLAKGETLCKTDSGPRGSLPSPNLVGVTPKAAMPQGQIAIPARPTPASNSAGPEILGGAPPGWGQGGEHAGHPARPGEAQAPTRHVFPTWVSGWTWKGQTGRWVGEPGTELRGARPCAGPRRRGGGTLRCRRPAC